LIDRKPRVFYGYFVAAAALGIMVIYWGTFYTFGVFFKPLSAHFEWTRETTSLAYTINAVLLGFMDIIVGKLTDKFGPRVVLTVTGIFLGAGYLLMSQISNVWQFYLYYGVIVAIGMGGSFIPIVSTIAKWFVKRRGLMTGIVVAGIGIGTLLIPPIATKLIIAYDWSRSYIIVGAVALVLITLAAQFIRRDPSQMGLLPDGATRVDQQGTETDTGSHSLTEAFRTRQFWLVCALFFGFLFCVNTIMVHIANHATDLNYSETDAALIISIIGAVSIAGRLAFGAFSDKADTKTALIIALIMFTAALFSLQIIDQLWMLYLFAVIYGFGYGGLVALSSPLTAELFGLGSHGVILGFIFFFGSMGQATGPWLAGKIFDTTLSYQSAFLACGIIGIICIILTLMIRPTALKGGEHDSRRSI